MARMIPDYVHRDCKSSAEEKLFDRFKQELPDSYIVLHSLGIAKHAYKLRSEIDFVVLCRRGILCIEVKGGRIRFERGVWSFINKYDEVQTKRESPFQQSGSAMYSLLNGIKKKFGKNSVQYNAVAGFSVVFPDQKFSLESPEWDLNRLIDKNRISEPLKKLIEDQIDYSASEICRTAGKICADMEQPQVELLLRYFRPDFELVPALSSKISASHDDLLRLTEEQYYVLDQFADNPRILVTGGAGTGKTLLAVEKIRRELKENRRVIYLCYNRLLAKHIRKILINEVEGGSLEVNTLHGYTRKLIDKAGLNDAIPNMLSETFYTQTYPELFSRAFVELYDESPFDSLVVDEGQDLNLEAYISMLDWLVQGGMREGRWIWFEDRQQNIFLPEADAGAYDRLKGYHPALCQLVRNCRNTEPISVFNSMATATDKQKCLVGSDVKVSPGFYKSDKNQLKKLDDIIRKLLGEGVSPGDIVLLSQFTKEKSILKGIDKLGGVLLNAYEEDPTGSMNVLRYTTVKKFKGLESKVIVVTDINELHSPEMRALNYVAFSRPTSCLEVLIHEDVREQYLNLAYQFGFQD